MLTLSDLTPEQSAAIDRLYDYDETLLIAKVGFGKAIVGLTALNDLHRDGHLKKTLVLAPLQVCVLTWAPEPAKWAHIDVPVAVACGTAKQRREAVESDAPVVVLNFENVPWLLKHYGDRFDSLLVDEITKLKTVGGTTAKALRFWSMGLKWRAGMSGTPVAEAGDDIYGQALLIDSGKALGTRKVAFQKNYMRTTDHEGRRWAFTDTGRAEVAKRLRNLVFMADTSAYEAALPPVEHEIVEVEIPIVFWRHYRDMRDNGVLGKGSERLIAGSQAVRTGKLQQLASGGVYDEDGGLFFRNTFKIDALEAELADISTPVAVVYQYAFDLDELKRRWPDAPVVGKGFTADDLAAWNRGEIPLVFMHPKAAAHGLNLQYGGHTLIELAPLWSADNDQQVIGRFRRRGQPSPVVRRITFCSVDTVEETMLNRIDEKAVEENLTVKELDQ